MVKPLREWASCSSIPGSVSTVVPAEVKPAASAFRKSTNSPMSGRGTSMSTISRPSSSGMYATGEEMKTNLPVSKHWRVHIPKAAPDFGRFLHRLMEVLQEKQRRAIMSGDESSAPRGCTDSGVPPFPSLPAFLGEAPPVQRNGAEKRWSAAACSRSSMRPSSGESR